MVYLSNMRTQRGGKMKEELEKALLVLVEKYNVEIKVHVSDNKKVVSFQGTVREKK